MMAGKDLAALEEERRQLEQWREFLLCRESFAHFYFNYWYVEHPTSSDTPGFHLPDPRREYQREEIEVFQGVHDRKPGYSKYQVRLKARQIGWTTLALAGVAWCAFFHPGHHWSITSRREEDAKRAISKRMKPGLRRLPDWMKQWGPKYSITTRSITFTHNVDGVEVETFVVSTISGEGAGRSDTVFGAILDEAAYIEGAEDVFTALRPSVDRCFFMFSTANGMGNFFHDTWLDSQEPDSVWQGRFLPWNVVPERDERWYEEEKRAQRHQLWKFYQEYPSTPEEAFAKSGRTAWSDEFLAEQDWRPPDRRLRWDWNHSQFVELEDEEWVEDPVLDIWQEPWTTADAEAEGYATPIYAVGVDVAEGLEHGDYTVIKVLNANTGEEAASLRAKIPLEDAAEVVAAVGHMYNTALIGVEVNNQGYTVINGLRHLRYPRLYRMPKLGTVKTGKVNRYGWHTNKASKPKMIADMSAALRNGDIRLHDRQFRTEASWFVSDGRGIFSATPGRHDDVVMATMIAWQVATDLATRPHEVSDTPRPGTWAAERPEVFEWIERLKRSPKRSRRAGYTTRVA